MAPGSRERGRWCRGDICKGPGPCGSPGAVYICTEDTFPDKRLQQLIALQPRLRTDAPGGVVDKLAFGDRIFIEHAATVVSV